MMEQTNTALMLSIVTPPSDARCPLPGSKLGKRPALGRGEDDQDLVLHPADIATT